jgi:dTMP kinase
MAQSIDTRGVFITLEGPDGAGKSSQQANLAKRLAEAGETVTVTREPGGTQLGERVRAVLLDSSAAHDPLSDALLFNAARHQLVKDVIAPALVGGGVVLCDRFADSTLAYQGYGAGALLDMLKVLAEIATDGLRPTRTVLLDIPVEDGLARRRGGPAAELTRFETSAAHDRAFHERVRAGYLELAAAEPARWRIVDASRPPEEVAESVWEAVRDLFSRS